MNYIIFDLEWNSAYFRKEKRFINEIIQIGAVKLDCNFEVVDKFLVTVRSAISKKLSNRFINLTNITNEDMLEGVSLSEAFKSYNEWCGTDIITMSWSDSDLYAIIENSKSLLNGKNTLYMEKYLDLQTFVQNELRLKGFEITNQISLNHAAEMLNISTEGFYLHTALDDSAVCGLLLKNTYNKERFEALIKDATKPEFYKRLTFKPYYLSNINDNKIDRAYLRFVCPKCNEPIKKYKKYKYHNNWFRSNLYCDNCDIHYKSMISFKQTFDRLIVKKRLLPIIKEDVKENVHM